MAQQLIFTSTPQGLEPGRSGYCTVARHKDLRHRLVRELERLSVYDFGQQTGSSRSDICIFRKVPLGSEEFYVLTKICDAGLDYTNRTNYLAHHLVLDGFEIATSPSPAEIFLNWNGWLRTWTDGPRYLDEAEIVTLTGCKSSGLVPCQSWLQVTNDPGNAASLVSPEVIKPIVLESKEGNLNTLLTLFAESSALFKISLDAWDFSFTTFLQGNDDAKSFAWIGIQGQPAGERLKQGGIRNYLDLRNWSASEIADPLDPNLQNLARKGPVKAAAKKKSATVSKAPFSDQELLRAKAAAPVAAAPAGSTMVAQEAKISKSKKKRPWLLQLAVISTALSLLAVLIWGLMAGLGDWFKDQEIASPKPENPPVSPDPDAGSQSSQGQVLSVVPDSPVQVDRTEYLRLVQTHFGLNWVKLDAGGGEVVQVALSDGQREAMGKDLLQMSEGEELEVVISRDGEDKLSFESIERAPDPKERGRPRSINLAAKDSVSLSDDKSTLFFSSGEESYPLSLRLLSSSERRKMLKLFELVQAGSPVDFMPRVQDGRIVYYDPVKLPLDPQEKPDPIEPKVPSGTPRTLKAAKGSDFFYYKPLQGQIELLVDKNKLPYVFRDDERAKIDELVAFLKKGEQEVDLKIKVDGKQITFLDFELPEPPATALADPELGPADLTPEKTIVFWIPGKRVNGQWNVEPVDNYVFEDPDLSEYLTQAFMDEGTAGRVWMTDFQPGFLTDRAALDEVKFEEHGFDRDRDPFSPDIMKFPFKQTAHGRDSYSFTFKVTSGKSIQVETDTTNAKNYLKRGKLIRLPLGREGRCLDLLFFSNLHGSMAQFQQPGEAFGYKHGKLNLAPLGFAYDKGLHFLSPQSSPSPYLLGLSVASSENPEKIRILVDKRPDFLDWRNAKPADLSHSFFVVSSRNPNEGTLVCDEQYAKLVAEKLQKEVTDERESKEEELKKFGKREIWPPIEEFRKFVEARGYAFKLQGLGISIYDSTRVVLEKVLEPVPLQLLLKKIPPVPYRSAELAHEPRLANIFWSEVSNAVKVQIDASIRLPRRYEDATAAEDLRRLFDFLDFMIRAERAFGFTDGEGLFLNMQEKRLLLSSVINEKSTFRMLQSQLKQNSEALNLEFSRRYQIFGSSEKDLPRYELLKSADLSNYSNLFSNRDSYLALQKYATSKENEDGKGSQIMLAEATKRMSNPKLSLDAMNDFVKVVPWTLAVYKRGSQGDFEKESDFLRLSPPQLK